jgi:hypothetical protein
MGNSEFLIPQPSPDLDQDLAVKSFSYGSNAQYKLNLYRMTCSCSDFNKRNRKSYPQSDIRRMCKHLMLQYSQSVELSGLSDFNRYAISNCTTIKGNFFDILIETTNQRVFINFWEIDEWWDIFLKNTNGEWQSYKYVPHENDFAYGEKPRGIVRILKKKLRSFYQWSRKRNKAIEREKKDKAEGCAPILVLIITICFLICAVF